MLVLSRQRDETIMIGDDIEITVVDIRGDKVRLGINAPTRIAVHRKEVYEAIRRENEQAAGMPATGLEGIGQALGASPISPGPAKRNGRASRASGLAAGRPAPVTSSPEGPGSASRPEPRASSKAEARATTSEDGPPTSPRSEQAGNAAGRRTA